MPSRAQFVLGMEGSANKIGIGIVSRNGDIVANVRETYAFVLFPETRQ